MLLLRDFLESSGKYVLVVAEDMSKLFLYCTWRTVTTLKLEVNTKLVINPATNASRK